MLMKSGLRRLAYICSNYLCGTFTYLELVSLDCGLAEAKALSFVLQGRGEERIMGTNADKRGRMASRLKRATAFVQYLQDDENREKSEFLLGESEEIMWVIRKSFEEDKEQSSRAPTGTYRKRPRHKLRKLSLKFLPGLPMTIMSRTQIPAFLHNADPSRRPAPSAWLSSSGLSRHCGSARFYQNSNAFHVTTLIGSVFDLKSGNVSVKVIVEIFPPLFPTRARLPRI